MTITALLPRFQTSRKPTKPAEKPVMTWAVNPVTGRPEMVWTLPTPVAIADAA